ncbi:valine--tRNA ligase [Pseudogemmobacter sp. W21_MBD1_M6]|uniref:valine--tRNA ligase n=1 Tax=Pseudogemmobacter sp. W21_MBD1_M6 TaxID=3240271 RepID=UPI003F946A7C
MAMEKTFDAAEAEPRLYAKWEQAGAFKAGANARPGADPFCIMIPPPNVTGSLHMGHAFNNTLQDILVRWHRMRGFDTLWQPGQDHAGIATQMVVERDLAKAGLPPRRDMGREAFLEKVWDWKEQSGGTIINQLKRLGASCDWSRNAFTMDPNFQTAVIKVFTEMYAKGLIYRGKRLVNWDPHFETAISDLEVESTEVDGHMWHFKYPLAGGATYDYVEKDENGTVTLRETRDYIAIATTRPETMLGDGAVAVHTGDARYAPIIGMLCEIPVGPKAQRRLIPIITDDYPDPDFGSGAVKITGAHDFNDYGVAQRNGIPCYRLMDTKAAMRSDGAPYAEAAATAIAVAKGERTLTEAETDAINLVPEELRGLDRFMARARVIDAITAEGLAVMTKTTVKDEDGNEDVILVPFVETKKIMQPFGDRSKVVIEPMLTDQWFVDTAKIVQPAIDAVRNGDTQILPEREKKVYFHWLENIEPWCISRQLWWGHQIPVWYGPSIEEMKAWPDVESGEPLSFCKTSFKDGARKVQTEIKVALGIKGVVTVSESDVTSYGHSGDDFHVTFKRDPDVLDTWFSSGLWPIGTLGWPEDTPELQRYFPTSTLITGTDILFFWVARMMMMQLSVVQQIPFKTVYLHGLVRDAKGKKMSKSLGNVVDPLDLIDEFGADALRFTNAAMASLGGALKLDTQRIAGYRNFTTKLWNAARFAEMNDTYTDTAHTLSIECASDVQGLQTVNRWIIGETGRVRQEVDAALENYRFNDAANLLYAFVWGKVCDWYVELSKPLLLDGDDAVKSETRATLAWVLDQCMILLHPIMPFITEELWNTTATREKMLVHTDWPTYQAADLIDENADREMNWVIGLIESIRSARAEVHVPAGLKVDMLHLGLDEAAQGAWTRSEALILKLARVQSLTHVTDLPKGCITLAVEGGTFALPLADIIDVAEEKSRLDKVLDKLTKELGGIKGRLNNPKFVASAPDEVVEENRERLTQGEDEASKIKAALARLSEIG